MPICTGTRDREKMEVKRDDAGVLDEMSGSLKIL